MSRNRICFRIVTGTIFISRINMRGPKVSAAVYKSGPRMSNGVFSDGIVFRVRTWKTWNRDKNRKKDLQSLDFNVSRFFCEITSNEWYVRCCQTLFHVDLPIHSVVIKRRVEKNSNIWYWTLVKVSFLFLSFSAKSFVYVVCYLMVNKDEY